MSQFQRCSLCRRNHQQGEKHVYSESHQSAIKRILFKFSEKVKEAKQTLPFPAIEKVSREETRKQFWCYFCQEEIQQHLAVQSVVIKHGQLLRHLAHPIHKMKTNMFWSENRIAKQKKNQFLIEEDEVKRFEAQAEIAVRKFLSEELAFRQKEAQKLHQQSVKRQKMVKYQVDSQTRRQLMSVEASGTDCFVNYAAPTTWGKAALKPRSVKTVAANGEGLTCIGIQGDVEGNVHTGAMPPWLQKDTTIDATQHCELGLVGPTMDTFNKHLENERKTKLPATRVGAQVDHGAAVTNSDWLPSFGRVWDKNRRLHSKHQFIKEWQSGGQTRSKSTDIQVSNILSTSPDIGHGYRKKPKCCAADEEVVHYAPKVCVVGYEASGRPQQEHHHTYLDLSLEQRAGNKRLNPAAVAAKSYPIRSAALVNKYNQTIHSTPHCSAAASVGNKFADNCEHFHAVSYHQKHMSSTRLMSQLGGNLQNERIPIASSILPNIQRQPPQNSTAASTSSSIR